LQARALQQVQLEADAKAAGERADAIRQIGERIESMTQAAMQTVLASTAQVVAVSGDVHTTISGIARDMQDVAGDAGQCLGSTQMVAGSAQELNSAIQEIAQQMDRAAAATRSAVEQTEAARSTFDALQASVHEIGDVAALIAEIAGRTNLLALNATIEAARAGDAGKGFAVVAGEVKSLALETARSTERIRQRIDSIHPVTRDALEAMSGIGRAVTDIDAIATAVAAAAEQQSVAVAAVSGSASQSSAASERMAGRMDLMSQDATRCEATMGEMAQLAQDIDGSVTKLKSDLVKVLRQQVEELDRRAETRYPVSMAATIDLGGVVYQGTIKDLSTGGAWFVSSGALPVAANASATLAVDGLPRTAVRIAGEDAGSLHLQWSAPSGELRLAVTRVISSLNPPRRMAA
jgi:methyl-accepting chemotaxis protein